MKKVALLIMIIVCLTWPAPLWGQEGKTKVSRDFKDFSEINLEELLSTNVTVASKTVEKPEEAPSSVTVFTQTDIKNMGIFNLQELLNFVPGFQTTRDVEQGRTDRIVARGRGTALSESVLFLINGQRINDLYSGGVSFLNRDIAVENIKQVEVIRGPGSALYGSNAFLGVVDITTIDGCNNVIAEVGDIGQRKLAVNYSQEIKDKVTVSAFLRDFSDDGYCFNNVTDMFGQTRDTRDPKHGTDMFITLKYNNELTVHGRYMERRLDDFMIFGALAEHYNHEATKQSSLDLKYSLRSNDRFTADFAAGYSQDRVNSIMCVPGSAFGIGINADMLAGAVLESFNANCQMDASYQAANTNLVLGGVSYEHSGISDVYSVASYNPITYEYVGSVPNEWRGKYGFNAEGTRNIIGVYVQDKQSIGTCLSITAGVRLDNYSDFGNSLNPRGAIVYSTPYNSSVKLMYGKAFRAPNFIELYDKNSPVDFGNTGLDAEKIQTIELAYLQNMRSFKASLAYFHNTIEDAIVLGVPVVHPDNPFGAPSFENSPGKTITKGMEAELKWLVAERFFVGGSFTQFIDSKDVIRISPTFGSLYLTYNRDALTLNLNGIFRSKMTELLPKQDAYSIVNSAVQYCVTSKFTVTAAVKNIFDEKYRTQTAALTDGVPNRGRTFTIGFVLSSMGFPYGGQSK